MGLEYQGKIKDLAEKFGAENLIVMLGFLDVRLNEIYAETLMNGDVSYAGPLAGIALRIPVYNILEPEIKKQIPKKVYKEHALPIEIATGPENIEKITNKLQKIRKNIGS